MVTKIELFYNGVTGPRDQWTTGQWDHGTMGPWDHGTMGPWDHGTTGPWDHRTTGRVPRLLKRHPGVKSRFHCHPRLAGMGAAPPWVGWPEAESQEMPVVLGGDPVPQSHGVGKRDRSE